MVRLDLALGRQQGFKEDAQASPVTIVLRGGLRTGPPVEHLRERVDRLVPSLQLILGMCCPVLY